MGSSSAKPALLPSVALIAGPTASGKSALALALAERLEGMVINADSAQVYGDLRVVTARPTRQEELKAPHRLYGYRDGAEACSAAAWAADAREAIEEAQALGKLPILVGGTGLYIRTLLDGIAPVPEIDADVRAEVRALPVEKAHAALAKEDPAAAARIRPTDATRVARALEVKRSTGRPLAEWQKERQGGIGAKIRLAPLLLLPPRDWLYERCDRRFGEIFTRDGVDEVSALLDRKLNPLLPVMRAIGVPEISAFLLKQMTRDEALAAGQTATRQYAKRQYTWFSRQSPPAWARHHLAMDADGMAAALGRFRAGEG